MSKRNQMPGLRLKNGIWHIEKRCKGAKGGWLRESTGTSRRSEAESTLINRLAEISREEEREAKGMHTFEEAGLRYLEDIAERATSRSFAYDLDQLFPFIGHLSLEHIHDGTLKPYVDHERKRGKAPKSINNAIGVVSAVLNRAARVWRQEDGAPWLCQAPPRLTRLSLKGGQSRPYPLSWIEQDALFRVLPRHIADAALYAVNTGCRDQEICQLRWDWEVRIPEFNCSVFVLPETLTKTDTERVVVLNSIAAKVIESRRGINPEFVFTYKGKPMKRLRNSGWRRAWKEAGLPMEDGILKGVHNLRHTFGRRLRGAGVSLETRKTLLGHANGDITTHYSVAELRELIEAAEKITDRGIAQTPALTIVGRKKSVVGKLSEIKKGLAT
ncbi:MAG: site-specific integrase [Gammaproteobacteria bacterium]|nr:site-specific integrase [Gammaproteobacteria bacterium]